MDYRTLRRPPAGASAEQQRLYRIAIASALIELGVEHDQDFVVIAGSAPPSPKARTSDPDTSKLAALKNEPKRGSQRDKIVAELVKDDMAGVHGATASDLAELLGIPLNSISTRMSECERGGWVQTEGTKEQDGSERSLYVPTAKALAAYEGRWR